jgi:hypothetical protein
MIALVAEAGAFLADEGRLEGVPKTSAQLDAEIEEKLRAPKIVMIEGEPWRVERVRFWLLDTKGGMMDRAWNFVRVSDGRTMTSNDKARGLRIVAERIRDGTYEGPPMYPMDRGIPK